MSSNTSSENIKMSTSSAKTTITKKSAKAVEPTVAATVTATVAAPAPVASVAAPAKVSKKAAASVAAVPAPVASTTVAAPVTLPASPSLETAAVEEDISVTLANAITKQHELVAFAKSNAAEQAANLKAIEKLSARLAKKADRRRKRKTEAVEGAAPKDCIFTKPVRISEELCSFLGKPKNTEVSRSAVTKGVMDYAKSHSLMDKQTINADASLRKLLTLAEGDKLTILNLQKFLRRHYIKATPTAA